MKTKTRPARRGKIGAVIMAAGRGTRMRCDSVHKVCFPLGGRPVIARTLETLSECGIDDHYIVVGHLADQVMQAAESAPGRHCFCYQDRPRGTGHAARVAARLIAGNPALDSVLVMAGDKVLEKATLLALIERFRAGESDLAFAVGPAERLKEYGRIIPGADGSPAGIVEAFDVSRMELLLALRRIAAERDLTAAEAEDIARGCFSRESKAERALGPLWETIKLGRPVTAALLEKNFGPDDFQLKVNGRLFPPETLARVRHVNLSVYLFRRPAFFSALEALDADNAQQEEYLTDAVGILAAAGARVAALPVSDSCRMMDYNTPEEIREIESHLAATEPAFVRERPTARRRPADWLRHLETVSPEFSAWLARTYGPAGARSAEKRRLLIDALKAWRERFGDAPVLVARAPGRVNLMGRHIDRQGGCVNMMAIDRDIFCVLGPAAAPEVTVADVRRHRYPERRFALADLPVDPALPWEELVDSPEFEKRLAPERGDWVQYVKGAFARLAHLRPETPLPGASVMVAGDLPAGAGVSSSSALFVAAAEGCAALAGLDLAPERFAELCGEGEWYVGTRGGAGDHAAIKCSGQGMVTSISFFPLEVRRRVPFFRGWRLVIANSGHRAHKSLGVKDTFNQRVACYRLARRHLARHCPETASLEHLRDFVDGRFSAAGLLALARQLPLGAAAGPPGAGVFPLREVFLFGLAECLRGARCADLLEQGDFDSLGRLMNASHDGDRVVRWTAGDISLPFVPDYSDLALERLAARAAAGDHDLALEPGAYGCSIPAIDRMVDIALSLPPVAGAQLSGAGLGGCIMVLLPEEACPALEEALTERYCEPSCVEPEIFPVVPAAGSGLVRF